MKILELEISNNPIDAISECNIDVSIDNYMYAWLYISSLSSLSFSPLSLSLFLSLPLSLNTHTARPSWISWTSSKAHHIIVTHNVIHHV